MAATYEPIASTTLGSAASTIEFTSIPGTYTDLIVVGMVDTSYNLASTQSIFVRFNGDTGSNYSATWLIGSGSAASSSRNSSTTSGIYIGDVSGTLGYNTPVIFHVMSYANTNVNKTVLAAADTAAAYVTRQVGLWRSTSAITTVTLYASGYNFSSGSTAALYGIKAA